MDTWTLLMYFFVQEMILIVGIHCLRGEIHDNVTWYKEPLHTSPVLFFNITLEISFPIEACCPIMDIYYTPKDYETLECFTELAEHERVWYKNNIFFLQPQDGDRAAVKCTQEGGRYTCTASSALQDYEPKMRWFIFGYLCKERQGKSLAGLKYHLRLTETNLTKCEPFNQDSVSSSANCSSFYDYVSFPNLFADNTQIEAAKSMDTFYAILKILTPHCHEYLEISLCRAFFRQCPIIRTDVMDPSTQQYASHLVPTCQETCLEIIDHACQDVFGRSFLKSATCTYFPKSNESNSCQYQPVTCKPPPSIQNSIFSPINNIYFVGSIVNYRCRDFNELLGSPNVTCQYSGLWTKFPQCIAKQIKPIPKPEDSGSRHNMVIYISLVCLFSVVCIALVVTVFLCRRNKNRLQNTLNFQYNNDYFVPETKRNRKFDAFVSYYSDGFDNAFVRNFLCTKLEADHPKSFKLFFHERDFRADTLIYVNIMEAIQNSNSAIIVLSQDYINSRWCREEFQECMEENVKDPSYRLFVILMKPEEELHNATAYMNKYMRTKTYLLHEDPDLLKKLVQNLTELRTVESSQEPQSGSVNLQSVSTESETDIIRPQSGSVVLQSVSTESQSDSIRPQSDSIRSQSDIIRPQSDSIRSQSDSIRTQSDSNRPHSDSIRPQSDSIRPQSDSIRPKSDSIRPQSDSIRPQSDSIRPQSDSIRPQSDIIRPQSDSIRSQSESIRPRSDSIRLQSDSIRPQSDSIRPYSDSIRPHSDSVRPQSDSVRPQSDCIRPQSDIIRLQSDIRPQSESIRPRSDSIRLQSDSIRPESDSIKPQSDSIRPQSDSISPQSDSIRSQSDSIRPQSDSIMLQSDSIWTQMDSIRLISDSIDGEGDEEHELTV